MLKHSQNEGSLQAVSGSYDTSRVTWEIRDHDGRLLVRGLGEFVLLAEERLSSVPEGLKKDMRALFTRFD